MVSQAQKNSVRRSATGRHGYEFTSSDFNYLRNLIGEHTGISLSDSKHDLVYGRLAKRLRANGLNDFREYRALLEMEGSGEIEHFINALTTNLTSFFREQHHFDYLSEQLQSGLIDKVRQGKRVRIWSAGCSTGEEPYSLAITLAEAIPDFEKYDIRILATDLDTDVVRHAANGVYSEARIEGLSNERAKRWFKKGTGKHEGHVRVSDKLMKLVTFRQLNLMQPWPMRGLFDVIFCRNVVIYFEKSTQRELFDRFANIMQPDGHLLIGHSETLHKVSARFELIGKTIYRRIK